MNVDDLSTCLEKLGNPTRLRIYRLLVRAGPDGLPVGRIQQHLGIPASTLSHHIFHLVTAGLIRQDREGRVLRCRANFERMDEVVRSLTEECCADVSDQTG
jgi:DNA-binding transcriptional ArsR family regulator